MSTMDMTGDPRWNLMRGALRHRARFEAFAADRGDETPGDERGRGRGRGRGGHRRGPRGFGPGFDGLGGPGFGPPFGGPGFGGFGGGPRGRRSRRSRGDIRLALLTLLDEQPRHGYEIIQEIAERTNGSWRPSPGSVYPTLQQLEDEGLVRTEESDGRRTQQLTDAGKAYVEEHREELSRVWDQVDDEVSEPVANLRTQYGQLHAAVAQIMSAGTDAQRETAATALAEARKTIYRLLAED
ncbi:PadR family transcriptional regulator [Pseudonocardia spinosispora]|uniref:PadR family transcriptional regulator n=1 Tax=Pseudonocardia spinosispora TaxID=103441 RepID=UPI0003FABBF3|nr:PadR family transcriptional regulator [Pseudonocardia spinosispora]